MLRERWDATSLVPHKKFRMYLEEILVKKSICGILRCLFVCFCFFQIFHGKCIWEKMSMFINLFTRRLLTLAVAKVTLAIDREPDETAELDDRHEETWKRCS